MKNLFGTLGVLGYIVYLGIGLFQLAAIYSFLEDYWGWPFLLSAIGGLIVAYIPVLGSICGVLGAIYVWRWEVWQAILLFCWPIIFMFCGGFGGFIAYILDNIFKKNNIKDTPFEQSPREIIDIDTSKTNDLSGTQEHILPPIEQPLDPNPIQNKKSFIRKLRYGEYSLPKTFWLFGIGAFIVFGIFGQMLSSYSIMSFIYREFGRTGFYIIYLGWFICFCIYAVNVYIGVWRSSEVYTGLKLWKILAKIIVCFWWAMFFLSILNVLLLLLN